MDAVMVDYMKSWDWQRVINLGSSLDELNDSQWRFLKGLVQELTMERFSGNVLVYVGEAHKDFDWPSMGVTVEGKAQSSQKMFTKKGALSRNFTVKLNNSNGTNHTVLDPAKVCDCVLVIRKDGAFVVDRDTVLRCARPQGDGFILELKSSDITVLAGPLAVTERHDFHIKEQVINVIKQAISSL